MLRYAKEKTSKKLENVTNDEREVWNLDSERNLKEKKEAIGCPKNITDNDISE